MTRVWAVIRREWTAYFSSPIAYAVLAVFGGLSGYFFSSSFNYFSLISFQAGRNPYLTDLNVNQMVLAPTFGNMSIILLLILPLLTMRLLAEERKSGTFELIMSYPIREGELIVGKYLAALLVFGAMLLPTLLFPVLAGRYAQMDPGPVVTAYLGLFLLGAAFIALGLFLSSLTENQIVAAVLTFGALLALWMAGWVSRGAATGWAGFLNQISIIEHFDSFAKGILDTHDLAYYLVFILFFLFLTERSVESVRWRG